MENYLLNVGDILYDEWKSRENTKRAQEAYKENILKNPAARLADELITILRNGKKY